MTSTSVLPLFLHRYFWDIDVKKFNFREKPQYVVQRLLEVGNLKAVRWLLRNFKKEQIKETIQKRRGFSARTVSFWANFFKIPVNKIVCLQKPYLQQRKRHWPY